MTSHRYSSVHKTTTLIGRHCRSSILLSFPIFVGGFGWLTDIQSGPDHLFSLAQTSPRIICSWLMGNIACSQRGMRRLGPCSHPCRVPKGYSVTHSSHDCNPNSCALKARASVEGKNTKGKLLILGSSSASKGVGKVQVLQIIHILLGLKAMFHECNHRAGLRSQTQSCLRASPGDVHCLPLQTKKQKDKRRCYDRTTYVVGHTSLNQKSKRA